MFLIAPLHDAHAGSDAPLFFGTQETAVTHYRLVELAEMLARRIEEQRQSHPPAEILVA